MKYKKANLKPDEAATLELRGLYEQYGYKKYKMSRFEEYSLYAENKDFLAGDKVITFTDLDGRLMALKPDVTLSIIKNSKATRESSEKLYYIENVYRENKKNHAYSEISQMGLEFIGDVDDYSITEVVGLAAKTLKTISPDYILEISHMSFVVQILQSLDLKQETEYLFLRLIRNKNGDGIRKTALRNGLSEETAQMLSRIPTLYGDVGKVIKEAQSFIINEEMENALRQLTEVYRGLKTMGVAANVQIDLSMVNDIDYYNGIIFKGYFKELARSVLAGGQYDRAMNMFGKDVGAIGFALYLNEVSRLNGKTGGYDIDALLIYDAGESPQDIIKAVKQLQAGGISVLAQKKKPQALKYQSLYELKDGDIIEREADDIC